MRDGRSQVIALAGAAQSALWVHELAQTGRYQEPRLARAVDAILCTDPETAEAVFSGVGGVADGLRVLAAQLGQQTDVLPAAELSVITRHMGQLLRLAGKVQHNRRMLDTLTEGIQRAKRHQALGADARAGVPGLAELYTQTVSKLKPRIMVQGRPAHLNNRELVATIRVFLLCGVRAGVLWRQCGGRLWQLVLRRRRLAEQVRELQRIALT